MVSLNENRCKNFMIVKLEQSWGNKCKMIRYVILKKTLNILWNNNLFFYLLAVMYTDYVLQRSLSESKIDLPLM